jgi:hypothetical protein
MDSGQPQGPDGAAKQGATAFGYALSLAQVGDKHEAAKVIKGFGAQVCWKWSKTTWVALTEPFTQ